MNKERAILQTRANILSVLAFHRLPMPKVLTTQIDRITAEAHPVFREALEKAPFKRWPFHGNHGATAVASWRECCPRYSLQAVEHGANIWEFDVDYVNPHPEEGLVFTVGHAVEVLFNKLRRKKTNPFTVRKGLLNRGIDVPEVTA